MKTYKLRIKGFGEKTHLIGDVVVMAMDKQDAIRVATEAIIDDGGVPEDFKEPVEFTSGVVYVTTKSAWDGYH